MPPESLSSNPKKDGYNGFKADIWSLGVTFYCLVYFKLPFYHDSLIEIFKLIQH
jgi:serine/threonine protein kinase